MISLGVERDQGGFHLGVEEELGKKRFGIFGLD